MRRLYYLADDLDTTEAISVRLHGVGISDFNFHVLAKDSSGLYSHHIHSGLPHHHKDLIRTGEVGALVGLVVGFVLATVTLLGNLMSWVSGWFDVLLITIIGALLGGLLGVRAGMRREHHRLAGFHDDIEAGKYLILVDVPRKDKAQIRELMNMEFGQVWYGGNESTFVRPFKQSTRIQPQSVAEPPLQDPARH